jgi:dephospho-CoA kinase
MLRVGITGGMGTGKSYVASLFEKRGVPIYNCDNHAKVLMRENTELKELIIKEFGKDSYNEDGTFNVVYISNIVFNDPIKLNRLNRMVYPFMSDDFNDFCDKQTSHYVMMESAIIFETGFDKLLDVIVGVSATMKTRMERLIKRDGHRLSESDIKARIDSQLDNDEKIRKCKHIIINDEYGYGKGRINVESQVIIIDTLLVNASMNAV